VEKLLYVYWRSEESAEALRRRFIAEVKPRLVAAGAERLQININDFTDLSGTIDNFKLQSTTPKPDGIVSFWLSSAYRRAPLEALLAPHFARIAGYVVAESTILPNLEHPPREDERTEGFSQVTMLQVPPRLGFDEWRRVWFTQHTPVGIETQANFGDETKFRKHAALMMESCARFIDFDRIDVLPTSEYMLHSQSGLA
jgi:hypothetical protein